MVLIWKFIKIFTLPQGSDWFNVNSLKLLASEDICILLIPTSLQKEEISTASFTIGRNFFLLVKIQVLTAEEG